MSENQPAPTTYEVRTERTKFKESDFTDSSVIGRGAEANVYRGFSGTFGTVAIKKMNQADVEITNMTEIELLVRLSGHPNIVPFYGLLVSDYASTTCQGYVMQFMPMGCLHKVIHDPKISYDKEQIRSWIQQICLGLGHLHRAGIIHRDIKPSNLLLGEGRKTLMISDFGTARRTGPLSTSPFTQWIGTPYYMAPEVIEKGNQVNGQHQYSFPADIYSLAITLWEISRRQIPYSPLTVSVYNLIGQILQGERPEFGCTTITDEFDSMIERGWSTDPSVRPPVSDFLEYARSHGAFSNDFHEANDVSTNPIALEKLRLSEDAPSCVSANVYPLFLCTLKIDINHIKQQTNL